MSNPTPTPRAPMSDPARAIELATRVDELLADARSLPDAERQALGGVNWADLRCVEIEEVRHLLHPDERPYWRVIVEEATPGSELATWLTKRLHAEGWADIEVVTEW